MAADSVVMANAVNAPRELRFARMLIEFAACVADAALADPAGAPEIAPSGRLSAGQGAINRLGWLLPWTLVHCSAATNSLSTGPTRTR